MSEIYLDSGISNDDHKLEIPVYDLFRADHLSNTKRGGVYIYYRISLLLKILGIEYLQECINFEITIRGKLCRFVSLYRSTSQSQVILKHLLTTSKKILTQLQPIILF